MRIISYLISFVALFLFLNIILSFASPNYKDFLTNTKNQYFKIESGNVVQEPKSKNDYNEKIINSIEKLNEHITKIEQNSKEEANTGVLISSGITKIDELEKIPESFRKKIESLNLKRIENNGIFSIKSSEHNIEYTTFSDDTDNIKVYIFESGYGIMIDLFKKDKNYKVNETNNFFGYSFYLNPVKKDDMIRFVIQIEGKSIGLEVIKDNYDKLKNILIK